MGTKELVDWFVKSWFRYVDDGMVEHQSNDGFLF
jgi:hypothetical protein